MNRYVLPKSCEVRNAASIRDELMPLIASGEPLMVDGSEVVRCDTAGAQLLVVLSRQPQVSGRLSEALQAHLRGIGLSLKFPLEQS